MMFGYDRIHESKRAMRRKLAALPIGEKLRLLDAMRERAVALKVVQTEGQGGGKQGPESERTGI